MSLMDLLPPFYKEVREMSALLDAEDKEIAALNSSIASLKTENSVLSCSVDTLTLWEKFLKISPAGDIDRRRADVLTLLRGTGKLNKAKILDILSSYTGLEVGGTVDYYFEESTLKVSVFPSANYNSDYRINIYNHLRRLLPSHIGLELEINALSWVSVKVFNDNWLDVVNSFSSWEEIKTKDILRR